MSNIRISIIVIVLTLANIPAFADEAYNPGTGDYTMPDENSPFCAMLQTALNIGFRAAHSDVDKELVIYSTRDRADIMPWSDLYSWENVANYVGRVYDEALDPSVSRANVLRRVSRDHCVEAKSP